MYVNNIYKRRFPFSLIGVDIKCNDECLTPNVLIVDNMMTSSNGNIFRIPSHLETGEFPAQRPVTRSFDVFFFICVWIKGWVNNRKAGDLRRYRAHYDVTIMKIYCMISKKAIVWIYNRWASPGSLNKNKKLTTPFHIFLYNRLLRIHKLITDAIVNFTPWSSVRRSHYNQMHNSHR